MLDQETVVSIVKQYADLLRKELSPAAIILYGSYAKGNAREDSDIDVAVIFDGFTGDRLKTSIRLWDLSEDISLYIEPILLDSTRDRSGFVRHVYKTGQIIYQSERI
jgi:predicted nucleotidyltransferase